MHLMLVYVCDNSKQIQQQNTLFDISTIDFYRHIKQNHFSYIFRRVYRNNSSFFYDAF